MTLGVAWEGEGLNRAPMTPDPSPVSSLLRVTHTLCELGTEPTGVSAAGEPAPSDQGEFARSMTLATEEIARELSVDMTACIALSQPFDPIEALLLPSVVEVLSAVDHAAPDPGWDCVVSGSDLRAEILLLLAPFCGVRRVTHVRDEGRPGPALGGEATHDFRGANSDWQGELRDHLHASTAPVVVFDTTGDNRVVGSLLSALPARGGMTLLGAGSNETVGVNFYQDLHRKNATVVGNEIDVGARMVRRALNLLRHRLQPDPRLFPFVDESEGSTLETRHGRWVILEWDQEERRHQPRPGLTSITRAPDRRPRGPTS